MPIIAAIRRLRQEDQEFEANVGYTVRFLFKKNNGREGRKGGRERGREGRKEGRKEERKKEKKRPILIL
jgi:hypothetical protein